MLAFHHPLDDFFLPFLHQRHASPRHHLHETETDWRLALTLPGIRPEDLKLTVEEGVLSIEGETRDDAHRRLSVSERLRLPRDANVKAAVVTAEHGILTITFPKIAPVMHSLPVTEGALRTAAGPSDYRLTLALPGMRPADLKLTVEDGVLSIAGETKTGHQHLRVARRERLPHDADVAAAIAVAEHGILTVVLPKREPSTPTPHTLKIADVDAGAAAQAGAVAGAALAGAPAGVAASA